MTELFCLLAKLIEKTFYNLCNLYSFNKKGVFLFCTVIIFCSSAVNGQSAHTKLNYLLETALSKDQDYLKKENDYKSIGRILLSNNLKREETDGLLKRFIKGKDSADIWFLYIILNKSLGQADPEYGLHFLNQGLHYIQKGDYKNFADFYGNIGANYAIMGMDDLALKNILLALDYINKGDPNHNIPVKRLLLSNITELYLSQKNQALAIKYHQQSLALKEDKLSSKSQFSMFSKIPELRFSAEISHSQGKDEQAKQYLMKGVLISRKISYSEGESELLTKIGEYEKNYNSKIAYLEQSYAITQNQKQHNPSRINAGIKLVNCYLSVLETHPAGLSSRYSSTYLIERTRPLLEEIKKDIIVIDSKKDLAETYRLYSRFEKQQGNYRSSLDFFERFHQLNDSIYSQENKNRLAALQSSNEIELRDQKIEIGDQTIKEKVKQTWILVIGLFIVSILGAWIFYQNHKTKKKNQELDEANRIKTRFFSILNHDLRSPVGDLIRFLHLKKENPEIMDDATRDRLDDQTMESAENLLASMEDLLLWSKGQMEHFQPYPNDVSISRLFEAIKLNFSGKQNVVLLFDNPEHIKLFTDKNYLKTIIRNLTSNALKVLENNNNAQITWKAWSEGHHKFLSITDNGPGGKDEQFRALYDEKMTIGIKTGLGLHLVRDMAKAINCKVSVNTQVGKGTEIILSFDAVSNRL